MKFFKWMNKWNTAETNHYLSDKLANNKTFQKLVIALYNTPEKLRTKLEDTLSEEKPGEKQDPQPQKLLGTDKKPKNK